MFALKFSPKIRLGALVALIVTLVVFKTTWYMYVSHFLLLLVIGAFNWPRFRKMLLISLGAIIMMLAMTYYFVIGEWVLRYAAQSPRPEDNSHYTEDIGVLLGGDQLRILLPDAQANMRVCFYTKSGLTVAAAHPTKLVPGNYAARLNEDIAVEAVLVSNTSGGLVLSGLTKPTNAPSMSLAQPGQVTAGEEGTLVYSGGDIRVMVQGFTEKQGRFLIVIYPIEPGVFIGPGFSGSPVVQNENIIGFMSAGLGGLPYRGPRIGFARLAIEIYDETVGNKQDWSGKGGRLP